MNIENRCKVWSIIDKKWETEPVAIWTNGAADIFAFNGEVYEQKRSIDNTHAIVVYTGVNDKNDVEIYRGDIIKVGGDKLMAVTFENGCYYTKYNRSKYRLGGWKKQSIEKVGNIYETLELLR